MSNQINNIELLKKLRDTLPPGEEKTRMSVIIANYMGMEQALKTPTEEEVCEEVGKNLSPTSYNLQVTTQGITYDYDDYNKTTRNYVCYFDGQDLNITMDFPPNLITLIGQFYEGRKNNDEL